MNEHQQRARKLTVCLCNRNQRTSKSFLLGLHCKRIYSYHVPANQELKGRVMLRRLTFTTATWGTVPLRLALGSIFIGHGLQKVLGSFGGPGFAKFISFPAPFPSVMRPAWLWMGTAAVSELVGGILVLLGLFTRIGAFLISVTMIVAIVGVNWPAFFA